MASLLQDKVALVTGGSTGIGRTAALAFAREGARVVIANRSMVGGEETVRRIVADAEPNGYRFADFVVGVVKSEAFRSKRVPVASSTDQGEKP